MNLDSLLIHVIVIILIILFLVSGLMLRKMRKDIESRSFKIPLIGAKNIFSFENKRKSMR